MQKLEDFQTLCLQTHIQNHMSELELPAAWRQAATLPPLLTYNAILVERLHTETCKKGRDCLFCSEQPHDSKTGQTHFFHVPFFVHQSWFLLLPGCSLRRRLRGPQMFYTLKSDGMAAPTTRPYNCQLLSCLLRWAPFLFPFGSNLGPQRAPQKKR